METPSEAVLKANAIVHSEATNKLICCICEVAPYSKDWKSHISKGRHIATLERFNHTFENREDHVRCKICDSYVIWDMIKTHGRAHMIVPWYDPDDKYKIFYENHLLKFRTEYYCYLCDEIFQEWSTAYTHIGHEKHQNIVQGIQQSVPTRGSQKFYIDLISHGYVPGIDSTVECRFCGEAHLGYHLTGNHRNKSKHAQNRHKFIEKLLKRIENEYSEKRVAESSESNELTPKLLESETSKKNQVATNVSGSANRSMICNFLLEQGATSSDAVKIPDVTETRRQTEEEEILQVAKSSNRIEVSKLFEEYIPDYIVSSAHVLCKKAKAKNDQKKKGQIVKKITDDPNPFCLICYLEIPGHPAVKDHVTGKRHANSLKRFGCENIVRIEGNSYYCKSCDCRVTDFDNIYRHLIGNSHTRLIDGAGSAFDDEEVVQATENISNAMEIPEEVDNSQADSLNQSCIYIVRRNAKKSFCQICDETQYPVASKNMKEHIAGQRHKFALIRYGCDNIVAGPKNYRCRCCDSELSNLEKVYLHIKDKRHMSSMIKVSHEQEPQTRKRIRDKFEAREDVEDVSQPGSNLLSDYIFNHIPSCSSNNLADSVNRGTASNFFVEQDLHFNLNSKRLEPPEHARSSERPIDQIAFGKNATQPNAVHSFWKFSNNDEPPRQSMPFAQLIYRNMFDNNNTAQPASTESFWEFPNKGEAARQAKPFVQPVHRNILGANVAQPNAAASYSKLPNRVEPPKNPYDLPVSCNGIATVQISAQPELKTMFSSMATELSRFLELSETKQTINLPRPRLNERIREQENDSPVKKIYCDLCDVCVDDMTKLHVHMASHFSEEFVRPKRHRYMNGMRNNYSGNDRMVQNCIEGSQLTSEHGINGNVLYNNVDNSLPVNGVQNGNNMPNSILRSTITEFESSNSSNALQDIDPRFPPARHTAATGQNNNSPQKKNHSPKKANIKKVIELLDFDKDYIYDMNDKMSEIKLGMKLCLIIDSSKIYCLICQRIVENKLQNYFEHLCSVDHCNYLEEMEQDSELFENVPDQFSDLNLAQEYMQEISDEAVRCFICDQEICNNNQSIEQHICDENHKRRCSEVRINALKNFQEIKPRIHCDWYNVQKYWCVICLTNTESEVSFVKHLESRKHANFVKKPENDGKRLIFDFCAPCALLWYGYRCTYSYHSEIPSHKWLTRDGHYVSPELPRFAKSLLATPEEFIENKVKYLEDIYQSEREKEERLIGDMEKAVKNNFPRAKAYTFGSRVSGLGSPDSDIDVYLDCRNTYEGNDTSETQMSYFMFGVHKCLSQDPQSWDVEELLTNCRSPIIRAYHRATGLNCDISFQNGLSVENTKLIKTFNTIFPTCRKLILFLKQWLAYCDLTGSERITSYALYWYVIFYLQKESILPSIATLIAMSKKSHRIAGWEVSVCQNFTYNKEESNYSIKEFLTRFFKFYADFNFRHYVASPLLGEELKKREFAEPQSLPKEMALYVDYIRDSKKKPEPFRIDSAMCIQDPFDLQHNLTKAVNKVYLNRFRTCCSKSLDLLCST